METAWSQNVIIRYRSSGLSHTLPSINNNNNNNICGNEEKQLEEEELQDVATLKV